MNITTQLPLFLLASLAVLLSPGPNVLYVTTRSIEQGRKAGVISVLGLQTGTLLQLAAVALGISAIGVSSALPFDAVRYLGAAYLLYLGVGKALEQGALAESRVTTLASLRRIYAQGVLVSVANPKTGLFFLAFLPQFIEPLRGNLALQTAVLGMLFVALATATDGGYALLAASLGQRLRRSKHFAIGQRWFSASVLIALGVSAALAERA
jgi:threonine/homoserine/homoserine lactone efflux protein